MRLRPGPRVGPYEVMAPLRARERDAELGVPEQEARDMAAYLYTLR